MLQMQGKEENDANKAKDSYERMQELIAKGTHFTFHEEISRRILPPDVKPGVDRRVVDIPPENSQQDWLPEPKKKGRMKKPPKVFHMPDGVLTGFVTAGRMDEEIVPKGRKNKAAAPVYPSDELFTMPSLETVLLNEDATKDLERRFQTVFDDEDAPMVNGLDFSRHPERQLQLSTPQLLGAPGRRSRAFVGTMQRMNNMNVQQLEAFKRQYHLSDCESDADDNRLASDTESRPVIREDMWVADDDEDELFETLPAPKSKAKPGPKPKAKPVPKPKPTTKEVSKPPASRGRPRKDANVLETPVREPKAKSRTPRTMTPNYRVSGLAQEGGSSSPPPTDPRYQIASQADTVGSDDTIGYDEIQDTQAYKMDSELASFIVEDNEEADVLPSSLPSLDMSGVGRGTQAVVKAARPKRAPKAEKIFTSDPTDDDAVVSSDSDDDVPLVRPGSGASNKLAFVVDSSSGEEEVVVVPRQRTRRVIEDDEDDE